jgi:hypothetical protein
MMRLFYEENRKKKLVTVLQTWKQNQQEREGNKTKRRGSGNFGKIIKLIKF